MADSEIRSQVRTPNKLHVELVSAGASPLKEAALAENVSVGGARIATEKVWRPGDQLLLTTQETGIPTPARVVYCQRLENGRFAVGLELSEVAGPSQKRPE